MSFKKFTFALLLMFSATTASQAQVWNQSYDIQESQTQNPEDSDYVESHNEDLSKTQSNIDEVDKERHYKKVWNRKKYLKVGLDLSDIKRSDGTPMTWDTQFAAFIQMGKTVYFHPKPIAGMIKIGLDYSFLNLGYAKLKLKSSGSETINSGSSSGNDDDGFGDIVADDPSNGSLLDGINLGMHKFEYGLHVGPSISINPWNHIIIAAYFHAMPMFSGIVENKKFSYGFGCAMTAGASVSYKLISVGVEGIWDSIKYHQTSFEENDNDNPIKSKKFKLKQAGPRVYVAFRF